MTNYKSREDLPEEMIDLFDYYVEQGNDEEYVLDYLNSFDGDVDTALAEFERLEGQTSNGDKLSEESEEDFFNEPEEENLFDETEEVEEPPADILFQIRKELEKL